MSKPRVFIGFSETAGYCAGLKKGFDEIGVESNCFMVTESVFQFDDPGKGRMLARMRAAIAFRARVQEAAHNAGTFRKVTLSIAKVFATFWQTVIAAMVFCWAAITFDVFIIQGRTSFVDLFRVPIVPKFFDLALLKLLRKKIIYVFHGTDSRPAYVNGSQGTRKLTVEQLAKYVRKQHRDLGRIEKFASVIIHYPLNAQLHRKQIISHEFVGRPVAVPSGTVEPEHGGEVIVGHAPSDPIGKGTALIEAVITNLQKKGHSVRLVRPDDRSHSAVKKMLAECDFVVDQVFYDVAISYVATEAAFLGKATVIGTNARDELIKVTPPEMLAPTVLCLPEEIEPTIERLIVDEKLRRTCGEKARRFVETHYGPLNVAENFLKIINGSVPANWFFDPNSIEYVFGYGYEKADVKKRVHELVQQFGTSALCLDDKPQMRDRFLNLL
ncbi:MAG: putative aminotransferase, class-II [Verrucomicrobiales bacterium]|nr:putative aminotransferase, class-II [Verrucomicrobiales bacterium]